MDPTEVSNPAEGVEEGFLEEGTLEEEAGAGNSLGTCSGWNLEAVTLSIYTL